MKKICLYILVYLISLKLQAGVSEFHFFLAKNIIIIDCSMSYINLSVRLFIFFGLLSVENLASDIEFVL